MTFILGISCFYHDSAACLLNEGEIVACAQEERFTRIKNDSSFPQNAIKYVLSEKKLSILDIDYIVFYEKPILKFERLLETYLAFAPKGFESFAKSMPLWIKDKLFQKNIIYEELKKLHIKFQYEKIKFSEHHLSHAASAFFTSNFKKSIILTLDGVGEWSTTTHGLGLENKIKIEKDIKFPHSIGLLYSSFAYYLGFKVNSGEYKMMGLAPYGNPIYVDLIFNNLIDVKYDGSFRINMNYFNFATGLTMINSKFEDLFNKQRRIPETTIAQFHADVASSIQRVTEIIIKKIVLNLTNFYQVKNLCLAGGVALNCVANGKLISEKIVENLWIQPAAGDAGGALGAALAYWHLELQRPRKVDSCKKDYMNGSYLGPSFTEKEVLKKLNEIGAIYRKMSEEEMLSEVATQLNNNKAIGWFQGRMEFGPRALGNRSILASPKLNEMQKNLNLKIKFRESFRPFAPSVLEEDVKKYFKISTTSPYMLIVSEINENIRLPITDKEKKKSGLQKLDIKKTTIPAVTHVDYSARVHTVNKEINLIFYKLIKKFKEISDCSVLVNTSFNLRGQPIVCSVEDAYECFMSNDLDLLVFGNVVLKKENQFTK
jgi:carbamoyltransferase